MPHSAPKPRQPSPIEPEPVSSLWLIKAIGFTIVAALVCGYLTFCLLFYKEQWQLVLHPVRTPSSPATIGGTPYQLVRFAPHESAQPQLTGWWIPAKPEGRYADTTLLFLPDGDGSLADSVPLLADLHTLGINIFAFDYRGYGASAPSHPSQEKMMHDADSAWQYLTATRSIPGRRIVPYGLGTGAAMAAHLAVTYNSLPALILDNPRADLLDAIKRDPRSSMLPVSLLFHEGFPLAEPLSTLTTPKLLISRSMQASSFVSAASPKMTVELNASSVDVLNQAILRFLDQYVPSARFVPSPAPSH